MSKVDKTQLIQTAVCSIIYGQFSGEYQELFRCPRELDDVDLRGYVNDNRCVLGFENDDTKNGGIDGRKCIGYFRLYFRNGWHGRWFASMPSSDDFVRLRYMTSYPSAFNTGAHVLSISPFLSVMTNDCSCSDRPRFKTAGFAKFCVFPEPEAPTTSVAQASGRL